MIVAEIMVTAGSFEPVVHRVAFADLTEAKNEYLRIAELINKKSERGNDLPKIITLKGISELTCQMDDVRAISLADLALANEHTQGMRDAFPHLNFK